ncbi:MAG: hypothetical protein ABL921_09240 [Pirellula sp.]
MPRQRVDETGFEKPQSSRRRFRKRWIALGCVAVLFCLIVLGIPWLLQNREIVVSAINRNAGIAPMRIDLASVEGGWLRPIKVRDLRLIDEKGAELIKVAEIETELNLIGLATNFRNLGTITIRGAEAVVDVQPGTTNIEEAIKPLLAGQSTPSSEASSSVAATSSLPSGRIRIADAIVHARDSVDLTAWDFKINEADLPLPTKEQPIPPITLIGLVQQVAALPGETLMGGQFTIKTQPIEGAETDKATGIAPMRMNISTNGMPLQWFSLIQRRLPDIPIDRISGLATVQADIEMRSNKLITAKVQTAQIDALRIVAPSLVGKRGANLQQVKLSGEVQLNQDRLIAQNAVLQCDLGALGANVNLPWPLNVPSLAQPWIADADLEVQGKIDLARVILAAPDLIQMQDQVQLQSGTASLSMSQRKSTPVGFVSALPPTSNYRLQLGGLQANVQGTAMRWDQALDATVDVSANAAGQPSFKADCTAEFCKIEGSGDLQEGLLSGRFDLAKMQQRLSQWFALPVESLSGSADCNVGWKQDGGNRLTANGRLKTTPVKIVNKNGQLNEPAWDGEFTLIARVDQGKVIQIDRGQFALQADGELLTAQVVEPISLVDSAPGMAKLPPAGIQLKLIGDLAGWQRRGQLFAGVDPGISLGGKCELDARGSLDMKHAEVTQANFTMEPLRIKSGDSVFQEARLVGSFAGRVDSQNITRLQVDNLLIQSGSFALQAKDEAVPNREFARRGNAGFRIQPTQLMSAIRNEKPSSDAAASAEVTVDGDVTGQIAWEVDPHNFAWKLVSDATKIRALQQNKVAGPGQLVSTGGSRSNAVSVLWEEPQAKLVMDGRYEISTGKLEVPNAQVMTEWIAYAGKTTMTTQGKKTQVVSVGNVMYDAARVAERLRPWTGDYLAVQGQKTQPLEITWTSSESGNWADSLQAKSQIGWDSANVVGIDVGAAEVPLKIENGRFVSKAEIPVSQGVLRWNLDGNVAGDPIVISQSPEKVIDNVAITRQMCQGWLKYVAPLLADVTSVQGNLSLQIDKAEVVPTDWKRQTIQGQLQVHGANVGPGPLADQVLMLVNQVRALRKGAGATDGGGQPVSWLQLPEQKISFDVEKGRVAHRNLQIQAGDVVINTSGSVGIDGQLELIASVPILKDWIDKTPMLQSLSGQQIQIPIRGTIQRPQMDLNSFATIGQQLATAALQGAAQKQIDKGLSKLLGPISQQLGPLQQGMQQMQQGVQQNMPQFPNLQNLPIPGFGGGGLFGGGQPQNQPPQPQPQQ